jgi:oligo-1,6-glucosidase
MSVAGALKWWQKEAVYQIYPRSFADANGDGVGDLPGITAHLRHVKELGAGIVWLSPIFVSPMADNGYDMADYTAIDPLFGTMDDFDAMIVEARRLGLRVVLDIALNHTSIAHPWFQAAAADPASPFRDHYLWADTPNNWQSIFGGPAWSRARPGGAHYLHLFDRTQADLNWHLPAVRQAIHAAMRFWLERGVSGFRLDVVTVISKPEGLPDAPDPRPAPLYDMLAGGPHLHAWLREMRAEVFDHHDCVAIGEGPGLNPARAAALVDPADPMLDMIYHFDLVAPKRVEGEWDRGWFQSVFRRWDEGIGPRGWNSCVMGNHDLRRLTSRFGDPVDHRAASAKALLTVNILQRATPFIYQGDELGMIDTPFERLDELDDVWAHTTARLAREAGADEATAFAKALAMTRDHARTPYPWTPEGGFSPPGAAAPWLRFAPRAGGIDAQSQRADPQSVRAFVRALLALRARDPDVWIEGATTWVEQEDEALFGWRRGGRGLALVNLSGRTITAPASVGETTERTPELSQGWNAEARTLGPWACAIWV